MEPLKTLKQLFDPPAGERQDEKLGRHIEELKKREDFFVFDGALDTPTARLVHLMRMAELINHEPTSVHPIRLDRLNSRRPKGGDRVVLEGIDKVKRLYVMYDIRETDNFPALAPVLRAVLMDAAEYKGGYGFQGKFKGELDKAPLVPVSVPQAPSR